jgi:protease PrsW
MPQGTIDATLDPLASPLRRPQVARALAWTLGILLAVASLLICTVVAGLGSAATGVFLRALALSSAMSVIPILILWYLDRRERESPFAYAAAFLTSIALPC